MIETSQGISSTELEVPTHNHDDGLSYCRCFGVAIRAPETPVLMDDHYQGSLGHGMSPLAGILKIILQSEAWR